MTIQLRDSMQKDLHTVTPGLTAATLEHAFIEHRVSGFPVVGKGKLGGASCASSAALAAAREQEGA